MIALIPTNSNGTGIGKWYYMTPTSVGFSQEFTRGTSTVSVRRRTSLKKKLRNVLESKYRRIEHTRAIQSEYEIRSHRKSHCHSPQYRKRLAVHLDRVHRSSAKG